MYLGPSAIVVGPSTPWLPPSTATRAAMSEADWERRFRRCTATVLHVKNSSNYRICQQEVFLDDSPFDPADRRIGKRAWEKSIQLWQRALEQTAQVLETMPPRSHD